MQRLSDSGLLVVPLATSGGLHVADLTVTFSCLYLGEAHPTPNALEEQRAQPAYKVRD